MISSIKYISPALFFNKSFLKSYQYLVSLLYFIQSLWLYLDLISNKFIISSNMIPCIKYISPALLFNKSFLKSYQFILSILFLIQSLWLYVDIILNKFLNSLYCICWFHSDLLIINCSLHSKSCSIIMLFIIAIISTYIIIYSLN